MFYIDRYATETTANGFFKATKQPAKALIANH